MTPLQWVQVAGIVIVAVVAAVLAIVYLTSKWRKAADAEKAEYIAVLEARNRQLESEVKRRDEEIARVSERVVLLEGKLSTLTDVVLRQCRSAEVDPQTGGCRYCTKGLHYGEMSRG